VALTRRIKTPGSRKQALRKGPASAEQEGKGGKKRERGRCSNDTTRKNTMVRELREGRP